MGVDTTWSSIRAVLGGAELQACANTAAKELSSTGADFSGMHLTPEQVVAENAGGGFANISLNGIFRGLQVVKLNDGKIYIDISSMRG